MHWPDPCPFVHCSTSFGDLSIMSCQLHDLCITFSTQGITFSTQGTAGCIVSIVSIVTYRPQQTAKLALATVFTPVSSCLRREGEGSHLCWWSSHQKCSMYETAGLLSHEQALAGIVIFNSSCTGSSFVLCPQLRSPGPLAS